MKNPRLVFLVIGFCFGASIGLIGRHDSQQTIEEYKERMQEDKKWYEKTIASSTLTISSLKKEVSKLKSSIKRVTVKNVDGSSTEVFEKVTDKTTGKESLENSQLSRKETKEKSGNSSKTLQLYRKGTNNKLAVYLGYRLGGNDNQSHYVLGLSYPVLGPILVIGQIGASGLGSHALLGIGLLL